MNANPDIKLALEETERTVLEVLRDWLRRGATIKAFNPDKPILKIEAGKCELNLHVDFAPNNHPQPKQTK